MLKGNQILKEIYLFLDNYLDGLSFLVNSGPFFILNPPSLPLTIFKIQANCDYFEINHTQRNFDNSLLRTEWLIIKCDYFNECVIPIQGGSDTNPELDIMLKTNSFGNEPRIFFLASWIKNLEQQGFLYKIYEKIDQRKKNRFASIDLSG
jgi:hypothetical protein